MNNPKEKRAGQFGISASRKGLEPDYKIALVKRPIRDVAIRASIVGTAFVFISILLLLHLLVFILLFFRRERGMRMRMRKENDPDLHSG